MIKRLILFLLCSIFCHTYTLAYHVSTAKPPNALEYIFNPNCLSFLLCQDKGRVCLYTDNPQKNYYFIQMKRFYEKEGFASKFFIERSNGEFTLNWHFDIDGPGWLNVSLKQHKNGMIIVDDEIIKMHEDKDNRYLHKVYFSYNEILNAKEDDEVAFDVRHLIKRIYQNPQLPELYNLKYIVNAKEIKIDDKTKEKVSKLIEQMDNDDWLKREAAEKELLLPQFYIPLMQNHEHLSVEQKCRVNTILEKNNCSFSQSVFEQLKR